MKGRDLINGCLPDELILEIFRRLDSKTTRDACSLACKRWLNLERFSCSTLRIGASFSPETFVTMLSRRFLHVSSIHVEDCLSASLPLTPFKRKRGSNISSSKHQKVGDKRRSGGDNAVSRSFTDAGLMALADGFPLIENLSLICCPNGCFVGDQGLAALGKFCKQLEELNLQFCKGLTDVGVIELVLCCANSLKSFCVASLAKVTDSSLKAIASHCKLLEVLFLDSECIHDKGVVAVVKGFKRLKSLKLQCVNVTDATFSAVVDFCVSLERLALYSFQQFTDIGMMSIGKGCKNLKDLTLSDCYFVTNIGLEAVAHGCKELTRIDINGCQNIGFPGLKAVGKSCPIGNSALCQIGKGCKSLEKLHIVDCAAIGDTAMCSIAKGCRNLKKLDIRRCCKVGDAALVAVGKGCSFLQQLNVSGCHQIGDVRISAIAKGCPQLPHLDISVLKNIGDISLAELGEGCPMLKDLVLTQCHSLTDNGLNHIVNKCKLLETCHMVYCPRITSAGVATVVSTCPHIKKVLIEKWKVSERTMRRAGLILSKS
ncbi:Leucine-rich repeat-containing protein [Hirschfeldia incana]|nr:Leucine-rich repeat-containing protein [Hirschfeldia incana]